MHSVARCSLHRSFIGAPCPASRIEVCWQSLIQLAIPLIGTVVGVGKSGQGKRPLAPGTGESAQEVLVANGVRVVNRSGASRSGPEGRAPGRFRNRGAAAVPPWLAQGSFRTANWAGEYWRTSHASARGNRRASNRSSDSTTTRLVGGASWISWSSRASRSSVWSRNS